VFNFVNGVNKENLVKIMNNSVNCSNNENLTKLMTAGDFSAKIGREAIFKLTIGNESLHKISYDNGIRVVNFATSKNVTVKSTMFQHHNIRKFTWTSPGGKTHNQIEHILIHRRWHSNILIQGSRL
jgi:Asp-tRNA(Asn)/Glu-tRNA(Gln) amidotransferase B subunit